jgi:Pyruvate/2-oxoacid:ferredoxin oxidoreductase delta subunit
MQSGTGHNQPVEMGQSAVSSSIGSECFITPIICKGEGISDVEDEAAVVIKYPYCKGKDLSYGTVCGFYAEYGVVHDSKSELITIGWNHPLQ